MDVTGNNEQPMNHSPHKHDTNHDLLDRLEYNRHEQPGFVTEHPVTQSYHSAHDEIDLFSNSFCAHSVAYCKASQDSQRWELCEHVDQTRAKAKATLQQHFDFLMSLCEMIDKASHAEDEYQQALSVHTRSHHEEPEYLQAQKNCSRSHHDDEHHHIEAERQSAW
jgi:hypothetical protein